MAAPDPIFPTTVLLPLSDPGGVQMSIPHRPGRLRPFVATLGVPSELDGKKHDTSATKSTYSTNSVTINDGTSVTDTVVDTTVDD
ncbi:MAG: hypothetical protein ACRDRH_26750 [Pseudonocardia sp.]